MEKIKNDKTIILDVIKKFNEEMIEARKSIKKGYYLYPYFGNTKIKTVEDANAEKLKSNLTCGIIVIVVAIVYFLALFKYPFETILYTIIGGIVLGVLLKK